MNQPTTLDLTGGWEGIVNNVERHNARCQFEGKMAEKAIRKRLNKALLYAVCAAVAVLLARKGLLALWVAVLAAQVLLCMACFVAGKVAGNREASNGR